MDRGPVVDLLFFAAATLILWAVNRDWVQAEKLSKTNLGYILALADSGHFGAKEKKYQGNTAYIGTLGVVCLLLSVLAALSLGVGKLWAYLVT